MTISIIALIISVVAAGIPIWQVLINKSALKVDLFPKRLKILTDTHDMYLSLSSRRSDAQKKVTKFTQSYRAAKFLFNSNDQILKILEEFHSKAFKILPIIGLDKSPEM